MNAIYQQAPTYSQAHQAIRSHKFKTKLPVKTMSGTVLKVFTDAHINTELNTHLNRTSLLVKLDSSFNGHDIIIVETEAKNLADILTTPKEGSRITAKGGYLACKTKHSNTVRKYPALKAFNIWNNEPHATIKDDLHPVFKMGLKMANNNITNKDVFAVVFQENKDSKAYLIDIIPATNRAEACKIFESKPEHQFSLNETRKLEPKFSKNQPDNHMFSIRLYRMDFKNPVPYWNSFGKHFEKLFENVMMND